ncbi:MAG: glycosyltransferase family 2 protein [Spirochaetaceae bacterium]|nr:MAG: glycosyltransferase family 2 protein [Spirochaetaceae bacterium]
MNRESPEVSIYSTVRDGEATLPQTLDSIAAQRGVVWELVVVDDGSSDRTPALLREFAGRFAAGAVRIIESGAIGRAAALDLAWRDCRSRYVANIDADDLFHPHKLAAQVAVMNARPDIAALATENLYVGAGQIPQWPSYAPPEGAFAGRTGSAPPGGAVADLPVREITHLLGRFNPVNHSSVMLRRSVLKAVGGYDRQRRRQLDYDLWIRVAVSCGAIHLLDLPLAAKRLHAAQFFEARVSPAYILSSFVLQNRAIGALRLPAHYRGLAAVRVLYRLLPTPLRRLLTLPKRLLLSRPP